MKIATSGLCTLQNLQSFYYLKEQCCFLILVLIELILFVYFNENLFVGRHVHFLKSKYRYKSKIIEKFGIILCKFIKNYLNYGDNMKIRRNTVLNEEDKL